MKIQPDKIKHFIAGATISTLCLVIGLSIPWTLCVVAVIGSLKEIRDLCGYGTPEVRDIVWTIAGAALIYLLNLLIFVS